MKRIQLFEFEDLNWFPPFIRQYIQDILTFMGSMIRHPYQGFTDKLAQLMIKTGERHILELCSGAGGPLLTIVDQLNKKMEFRVNAIATDLYPNDKFFRHYTPHRTDITYHQKPVDATMVPKELQGVRLMCNCFHHFSPKSAKKIIADAAQSGSSIAIIEMVNRSPFGFLGVFVGLLVSLVITPFIKPFRLSRFFLTYLFPIVPFVVLWDGLVSCLRVYSVKELTELTSDLQNYQFDIGTISIGPKGAYVTYLLGFPISKTA